MSDKNLIVPGKNWGWFDPNMNPLATGDMWHHLKCEKIEWCRQSTENFDGELEEQIVEIPCPVKFTSAKRDECTRCGRIFIYP